MQGRANTKKRLAALACLLLFLFASGIYCEYRKKAGSLKRLESLDAVRELCVILCLVASAVYLGCQVLILTWNTVDAAPGACAAS